MKGKNRKKKSSQKLKSALTKLRMKQNSNNINNNNHHNGTSSSGSGGKKTTVDRSTSEKHGGNKRSIGEAPKLRKYRTRQSVRDYNENSSGNSLDAPSTSTGITSSSTSSVYR